MDNIMRKKKRIVWNEQRLRRSVDREKRRGGRGSVGSVGGGALAILTTPPSPPELDGAPPASRSGWHSAARVVRRALSAIVRFALRAGRPSAADSLRQATETLKQEVVAYEELATELFTEVHGARVELDRIAFAATWKGRLFNLLGYFFSGYCVYKIVMSVGNIVFNRVATVDPITRGFELVLRHLHINFDVQFWSQNISIVLIGVLIITSVRGFLNNLSKFFYEVSSTGSVAFVVLFLAQVMGMYFSSVVLLMRMMLPLEYRIIITSVLGDIQFSFYHRWFDLLFFFSSLASVGFLFMVNKSSASRSKLHENQ